MINRRRLMPVLCLAVLFLFGVIVCSFYIREQAGEDVYGSPTEEEPIYTYAVKTSDDEENMCLGVPILTADEYKAVTEKKSGDYSEVLLFAGQKAAVDVAESTIYISQSRSDTADYRTLKGKLEIDLKGCSLYFAPDAYFGDLPKAIAEGHGFELLIEDKGSFSVYHVVFTTLPVVRLDGGYSHVNKDARDVSMGDVTLWAPADYDSSDYLVTAVGGLWNGRGAASYSQLKKPLKLSLIDYERENIDLSLLGLGADEDWILNAMNLDDTYMKEKLSMDVWNLMDAERGNQGRMSTGEYVEAVINGEYSGLYLLMRKPDENYLQLQEDQILLKGSGTYLEDQVPYDIEYSPLTSEEMERLSDLVYNRLDRSMYTEEDFIDIQLFIQWGTMLDNRYLKNTYYILHPQNNGYHVTMIPWDTDLSMGVYWAEGFIYSFDDSVYDIIYRGEYEDYLQEFPQLEQHAARRWFELRQTVYTEEVITGFLDEYTQLLTESGAFARDMNLWGAYYAGNDTVENLYRFFAVRLPYLDTYYEQFLD